MPWRRTTTVRPRAPPRPPSSTTRTSSTRRRRPAPSATTDERACSRRLLALGASVAWGTGDFLGGRGVAAPARAHRARGVAARGLAAVAVWALLSQDELPGLRTPPAAGAGAGRRGRAGRALPWNGGRRDGDRRADLRPVARRTAGRRRRPASGPTPCNSRHRLALAGVLLVSREPSARAAAAAAGTGLALVAAARLRSLLRVSRRAAPTRASRGRSRSARDVRRACDRRRARRRRHIDGRRGRWCRRSSPSASLDVGANVLFAFATTRGLRRCVAVLARSIPWSRCSLARLVLGERLGPVAAEAAACGARRRSTDRGRLSLADAAVAR